MREAHNKRTGNKTMVARVTQNKNIFSIIGTVHFDNVLEIIQEGYKSIGLINSMQVDLKELEHCDSSGLVFCTALVREANRQSKTVEFINIPSFMQNILRVYGLDSVLSIRKTV